jgi:phytoene dehydrogenase-like protein
MAATMSSAIVVGSGPNGLSAAATLAKAGVDVTVLEARDTVGGGARSSELIRPGLISDHCSAIHPMTAHSPGLEPLELDRYGLEWLYPDVDLAHPLDDGSAGAMLRSIDDTVARLGVVGRRWKAVFGGPAKGFDELFRDDLSKPVLRLPRHPLRLTRFGIRTVLPATALARRLGSPRASALYAGVAGHSFAPLDRPMSSAVGVALVCACHAFGWPVAKGGSGAITDALARVVTENSGRIETGVRVERLDQVADADAVVFDLAPRQVAAIAGDRLPRRVARAYERYRHGPGAFKIDMAIQDGVPWLAEDCRRAGTVHAIGGLDELARAEAEVNRGRMPGRPFVLVGQQYLADPSRSDGDVHPLWAYAHVPAGYDGDATDAIMAQVERFAPGFRERVLETVTRSATENEAYNPNYVDGDIITGANTGLQFAVRPRLTFDPYYCGSEGLFICSAATPPGPGAHGMGGANAAAAVLRRLG